MVQIIKQQQLISQKSSVTRLLGFATLLIAAITLHGCAEKCPEGGVPIKNGKVVFKKCKDDGCDVDKTICDKGYGYGTLPKDWNKQMMFLINKGDQCVIKFTNEPPYCHKCDGPDVASCEKGPDGAMYAIFKGSSSEGGTPPVTPSDPVVTPDPSDPNGQAIVAEGVSTGEPNGEPKGEPKDPNNGEANGKPQESVLSANMTWSNVRTHQVNTSLLADISSGNTHGENNQSSPERARVAKGPGFIKAKSLSPNLALH